MMRNFLVEALMLLAESSGLSSTSPPSRACRCCCGRRERAGYAAEPGRSAATTGG
jgi:hypothetical protein